jgi:hypothetical protein
MSCAPPTQTIGSVTFSTDNLANAAPLLVISGDGGDPVFDEYEENIANGNNSAGTTGVQVSGANTSPAYPGNGNGNIPVQTTPPTPSPIPAKETNTVVATNKNGTPVSGGSWTPGNYTQTLSSHFNVGTFTINAVFKHPLIDYLSYSAQTRFQNLQGLATNVGEALYAKYGMPIITSGIRNASSTPSGVSQHITGQAADFQWPGWNYDRYWQAAQWVKDNIPYDQFIFEHSDKTGLAWLHLSYNNAGNRSASSPIKVMTMYRNHYDHFLKRYH